MNTNDALFTFTVRSNYLYATSGSRMYGATEYADFPVRLSMPSPPGCCLPGEALELRDDAGQLVPAVIRPLLNWADGSVRVWEVAFPANLRRTETRTYALRRASAAPATVVERAGNLPATYGVTVVLGDDRALRAEVTFPAMALEGNRTAAFQEDEQAFELGDASGVCFKGALIRKRWNWYPGQELAVRLINYDRDETTVVHAVRLECDLPGSGPCRYMALQAALTAKLTSLHESAAPFIVRADAGGVHVADLAQFGERQCDYPPYERGTYLEATESWLGMADAEHGWVLTMPEARERMPKGWSIDGRHMTVELHPDWAEPLEWRRGMALYQRVYLTQVGCDATPAECENEGLRWLRQPLVEIDADRYRDAGWRIPFRYEPARFPKTEYDIRRTWNFSWSYGTFDWGDDYMAGKRTRNHEYDFIGNAAKEFARTGRPEIFKLCRSAAEHLMYTDFVPISPDPWVEGGVPAHCAYHTTGAAYPSHMWVEGILLYHLLTGDRYALTVAMRVGDFFLKYIRERFQVVEGTGREAGWTLVALAALYDITREERYLDGIKQIVDRYLDDRVENFFPTDATFCVGVALIGFDRVRPFYRGAEIAAFIPAVLDWITAHRCDEIGIYDYWHDSERKAFYWIQSHLPEALNIGYQLTGEVKYLKAAWRLFMIHQGGGLLTVEDAHRPSESGIAGGYHITWTMGCLQSFAERGWLAQLQYRDPEPEPVAMKGSS